MSTCIDLYLIIATIIVFLFYTLTTNYRFTRPKGRFLSVKSLYVTLLYKTKAPKAHSFIKTKLRSSMHYAAIIVGIITLITKNSAYLFAAGIFINMLYDTCGLSNEILINIMERLIRDITEVYIRTSTQFNGTGLSFETLRQIHTYLTPYLKSYHSIFTFVHNIFGFFGGSPELNQVQDLYTRFWGAGCDLLSVYRQIEMVLNISLAASPISTQIWGF